MRRKQLEMSTQDDPKPDTNSNPMPYIEHSPDDKPKYDEVTTFSGSVPAPKDQGHIYAASLSDEDSVALEQNPFLDPDVANHWTTVYEKSQYECRHVFDPTFNWTKEEERKLVRKLDWHVCLWAVSV